MFGYVLINKEELKFKEYDVYKSYYCGLCQTLNNRSGRFAQLTLNYDMTFLQLLLTGLYEPETKIESFRCKLHPLKKYIKRTNKITDYIADMNLFLAYLNCIDDWEDEKKLSRKIYTFFIKNKVKKIKKKYPEKTEKLEKILRKSSDYEKKKEYDYRMPVWYTYGSREISYPLHLGRLQILPLAPQQKSAAFHLPKPALLPRWQRPRSL